MTTPATYNLTIYRGDTLTVPVRFHNDDGTERVMPATGWAATVRRAPDSQTATILYVDTTRAAEGIITVTADAATTTDAPAGVWDLQHTDPDTGTVTTWLAGKANLVKDVTR